MIAKATSLVIQSPIQNKSKIVRKIVFDTKKINLHTWLIGNISQKVKVIVSELHKEPNTPNNY